MPRGIFRRPSPLERFQKKWKVSTEHFYNGEPCWEWTGAKHGKGYGHFWNGKRLTKAHRWSYEHFREPIPDGLEIDHLCRNRACIHPSHLEPVTSAENSQRGNTGQNHACKTRCPHGHPYDEANTYVNPKGSRVCRTCNRNKAALWRAKEAA